MAWIDVHATDVKDILEAKLKNGYKYADVLSFEEEAKLKHADVNTFPSVPSFVEEVKFKPRPARVDPSEPFQPWHRNVRECAQWDSRGNRFIVSIFDGGIAAVRYSPLHEGRLVKEQVLVPCAPRPKLTNLGLRIDYPRNRVVCVASDKFNLNLSTVAAYDYTTWEELFVVELQAGTKSLAQDLTLDVEGNIYVVDAYGGKIWKVEADGSSFSIFSEHPLFHLKPTSQYYKWKLVGILYHPKGFLLVTHMGASALLKVSMHGNIVERVNGLTCELLGDGIALMNNHRLVMAGLDAGVHILVSLDNWKTAKVIAHSCAPSSTILPTTVTFKDGRPFVSYARLIVTPYNTIAEPMFKPLNMS